MKTEKKKREDHNDSLKGSGKQGTENKPFIPKMPGDDNTQKEDPNDPNPNSDPNYSYFPNAAYPTGPEDKE